MKIVEPRAPLAVGALMLSATTLHRQVIQAPWIRKKRPLNL
ncbi:MAG: hypothetical protein BMS9Abin28_0175 [Anaerolineae bacterium]|nr:MAG: hypothetical protein BMS9Abin28_0175 [Anaerolineae bacterium]